MTFAQVTEYEAGKLFAAKYAKTYGTADAMTLLRRTATQPSKAPSPAVANEVAALRASRVAGMCDALLERVSA